MDTDDQTPTESMRATPTMQPPGQRGPKRFGLAKKLAFVTTAVILFFFFLEGFCTFFLTVYDAVFWSKPVSRVSYTQYDEELGWINTPNVEMKDLFGPSMSLKINAQGFREDQDTPVQVPVDKIRFLCSGDSFTFASGVGNEHAWSRLLADQDNRIEPVNLGVGGYGVGQIYLRYLRSGQALDHDVHLFAFISHNFDRMRSDEFLGYGKPVLRLKDGALSPDNVPVPNKAYLTAWLSQNPQIIQRFSTITLLGKMLRPVRSGGSRSAMTETQMQHAVRAIIKDLVRINREKSSTLVLVHVPTRTDYLSEFSAPLQQFLREVSSDVGVAYIDMIAEMRKLSHQTMDGYYLKEEQVLVPYAVNHFTIEGNRYFAETLYERLMQLPEIANRFTDLPPQ